MLRFSSRAAASVLGAASLLLLASNAAAAEGQPHTVVEKAGAPVAKPGAQCAECHDKAVSAFAANIHAHAGRGGAAVSCESCHTGALEHAQSGDPTKVLNPAKAEGEHGSASCLSCHAKSRALTHWRGSVHEEHGCATCHSVHGREQATAIAKPSRDAGCYACHPEVRNDIRKRSHHPLADSTSLSLNAKMSCTSCHNPHGSATEWLIDARSVNDKCYQCHVEKKAPVLWEHSPVREDCLLCHSAHGSSNDKLLTTRVPRLCQECHMQGRHQSGALPQNSTFTINRSCLNCHPQIHGSNHPSGTVFQR